jgi:tetratricopeptide (TPR) repeat protein
MKLALFLLIPSLAGAAEPTLIEQRIAMARQAIAANPKAVQGYSELAAALVRRARETGDSKYCAEADRAASDSLRLAPGSFDARKARVAVRLCQKRWADALEEATALHKQVPDDVPVWGDIADAQMALGNYDAAEKAAQWMIDLRRVNPQSLQRGAELREVFGYNDPALDWWNSALRLTSATDGEERAWILTRVARLQRVVGRYDAAEGAAKQALAIAPDYPWALDELAQTAISRGNFEAAVEILQRRTASVDTSYQLGVALQGAGKVDDARRAFESFEKQALALVDQPENANLDLVRYYSGPGNRPAEALRIAQLTHGSRQDTETLAVYAQALAAHGDWKAAAEQMSLALKPGVKDPQWLYTAGKMERQAGDNAAARKYFQEALESSPGSRLAAEVIQALTAKDI